MLLLCGAQAAAFRHTSALLWERGGAPLVIRRQSRHGDPLARFEAVRTETARLKRSHAADGIDFLGQLVDRTASTWLTGLFVRIALRVRPYNWIVSNVPGPQYPLCVLGSRLLELHPMPPLFERQGLGTAVMSYDLADREVVPDLDMAGARGAAIAAAETVHAR